jgi:hypothetical protein
MTLSLVRQIIIKKTLEDVPESKELGVNFAVDLEIDGMKYVGW